MKICGCLAGDEVGRSKGDHHVWGCAGEALFSIL